MKRTIYIISFTFLGILIQFLIHAFVETWYIGLLVKDFPAYSFGFSWENWYAIHHIFTIILFIGCATIAFFAFVARNLKF